MPRRAMVLVVVLVLLGTVDPDPVYPTDLGSEGNAQVSKRFAAYMAKGPRLKASHAKRRVLITGFGLFAGVDKNISGVVAESMADPAFWPASWQAQKPAVVPEGAAPRSGHLKESDLGAKAWQRTLTLDGEVVEVGFLVLDVLWDLGAAITLYEANVFRPHLIIMTGRGGPTAVFEAGALNEAVAQPGFAWDGALVPGNKPQRPHVLPPDLPGVERAIAMRWDNEALAKRARAVLAPLRRGYEVTAPKEARARNTYICNNIACAVLHAAKQGSVQLAGGQVRVAFKPPLDPKSVTAGFFHYPAAARFDREEVATWCGVLNAVIASHFRLTPPAGDTE